MSEAFSKQQRLLKPAEFKQVFAKPSAKTSDAHMRLIARKTSAGFPRLGLAVSKKALRHAVQRNRAKRLIRESFRRHQSLLPAIDVVVMVRTSIDTLSGPEILRLLDGHWQRLAKRVGDRPVVDHKGE